MAEQRKDPLNTMDARVWAAEFMKITGGTADQWLFWDTNPVL